jgi:hypothetical protein
MSKMTFEKVIDVFAQHPASQERKMIRAMLPYFPGGYARRRSLR